MTGFFLTQVPHGIISLVPLGVHNAWCHAGLFSQGASRDSCRLVPLGTWAATPTGTTNVLPDGSAFNVFRAQDYLNIFFFGIE